MVESVLKELNEDFVREKSFSNLKDKKRLRYDFFVPGKDLLIEFNGEQHYAVNKKWNEARETFLLRKHHDWLKRKYAKIKGYELLTIPYWEFDNIKRIIMESLNVPKDIR